MRNLETEILKTINNLNISFMKKKNYSQQTQILGKILGKIKKKNI